MAAGGWPHARAPAAAERGFKPLLPRREFRREQAALLLHMRGDPRRVAQHQDMAHLIELVGPDRAARLARDEPAHIDGRRHLHTDARRVHSDILRRTEYPRATPTTGH